MKIAFTGASGTGKTTLAKYVSETFDLPLNPVGCRSTLKEMGFADIPAMEAAGSRARFQERLSTRKFIWESDRTDFVTDRSGFDDLAYAMLECPLDIQHDQIWRARRMLEDVDLIFWCPISVYQKLDGDPNRKVSSRYHAAFEQLLETVLDQYWSKVVRINSAELEHRKSQVAHEIDQFKGFR